MKYRCKADIVCSIKIPVEFEADSAEEAVRKAKEYMRTHKPDVKRADVIGCVEIMSDNYEAYMGDWSSDLDIYY